MPYAKTLNNEKIMPSSKMRFLMEVAQIAFGTLFLTVCSQLYIPLEPVRMTLQTFAIFTLSLYMNKNKAFLSVLAYLAAGSLGAPVFPGWQANPFWFLLPTAGFYLSFPFAAYVIGCFSGEGKQKSISRSLISIFAGQCVLYSCGIFILTMWFDFEKALAVGFYPFLIMDSVKMVAAVTLKKSTDQLKNLVC